MQRILVVDDEAELRKVIRAMLAAEFEVEEAADGAEALRALRRRRPDVVLCDVFMPGRDGLEVIRSLRHEFPGVRVVAMSGGGFGGTVDMLPAARQLGAVGVLHKPFVLAAARAAIEDALRVPAAV